jgi:hypothetical protein
MAFVYDFGSLKLSVSWLILPSIQLLYRLDWLFNLTFFLLFAAEKAEIAKFSMMKTFSLSFILSALRARHGSIANGRTCEWPEER